MRVTARSLVPLMDVSDRVTRLECSAPRERRYATKARSPVSRSPSEAGRRVCEAVGPGPPALARWSPVLRSRSHPLIGVERIGLETDLVRRPRVRGTAPLATVGKERRLFYFEKCVHRRGLPLGGGPALFSRNKWSLDSFLLPLFTWLILPVVICLSQRLSHASVSTCRQMAKPRTAH